MPYLPFIILDSLLRRVDDGLNRLSRRLLPVVADVALIVMPPLRAPALPTLPPTPPPTAQLYSSLIFSWALCDEALQLLYRLLADGRLLKGAIALRGISSDGRGESLQTISANESILAERCKALLSLRL